jgi:hypothetical protein
MSTGPDPRFPAGNSPIRGRGRGQLLPHGDPNGRKTIPVGDGGDGDGNPSPEPDPHKPAPVRAYSVACFKSVQIGPRRPSNGSSIQSLTLIPQLPSLLTHLNRSHSRRSTRRAATGSFDLFAPCWAPPWVYAGHLPTPLPCLWHARCSQRSGQTVATAPMQETSHTSSSRWHLQSTTRCFQTTRSRYSKMIL